MKANLKSKVIKSNENVEVRNLSLENQDHHIDAISSIIGNISAHFELLAANSLSSLLRHNIEFKYCQQNTVKIKSYLSDLPQPAVYREFITTPHDLHGAIVIDGKVLFSMVDLFFGGNGKFLKQKAKFSDTETRLVERFFNLLLSEFSSSWYHLTEFKCSLLGKNTLDVYHPNKIDCQYQKLRFELTINKSISGWFEIILPISGLSFIRERQPVLEGDDQLLDLQEKIERKIYSAPIRLTTVLAERRLSLGQVMNLSAGDIVPVELPDQVTVKAGGTPLYKARVAENNSSLVLQIKEIITLS